MIFVQLILDNFGDNHFSPLVIGQKQWRDRKKKNKNTCVYNREGCFKSCQKMVVQIS